MLSQEEFNAMLNSNQIIKRIKDKLNFKTDAEVARLFGFHQANIRNWRERNTIAWPELYALCLKKGWSFDWLLTGKESTLQIMESQQQYGKSNDVCNLPPGCDEFYAMLKEILSQSSDEQVKNALRTNLIAFKNSIDKDSKKAEKDKRIKKLECEYNDLKKEVNYLKELYNCKTKSDT